MNCRALATILLVIPVTSHSTCAQKQYKRVHQQALVQILNGEVSQAIGKLDTFRSAHPDDAETAFVLALAHARAGRNKQATELMEQAHQLGLPEGRFLGSPRKLLTPLRDIPLIRRLRADFRHRPIHGPLVGAVSNSDARIWVRTAQPARVLAVCGQATSAQPVMASTASTSAQDLTAVLHLRGLRPNTLYEGRIVIDSVTVAGPEGAFRFSTPPAPGSQQSFTLAFGGGAGYVPENERMWTTVLQENPDLLLLLGDNVYIDQPKRPAMQRYTYHRRQSRPEWRRLTAQVPTFTIWDDHDFGTNDCAVGAEIDRPSWKRKVFGVFRRNWANPSYGGGDQHPGVWYRFSWGAVDFFMLDGRYYRENPKKVPAPSMLGATQKAWLFRELSASTATFKVICSPVPFEYRTKGASRDTWNGFHGERDELFGLLAERQIPGVVLMSADRHRSDAWLIRRKGAYDLYELNSSRLTNQHVHPTMKAALFSYNAKQSFGRVHFDLGQEDPTVTYEVVTIDGKRVHRLTIPRSKLQ